MIVPESWWLLLIGITLLTSAAVFGYRFGRARSRRVGAERSGQRTEIQRALSVIEDLNGIAARLRKAISQHGGATRRFTSRLTRCAARRTSRITICATAPRKCSNTPTG